MQWKDSGQITGQVEKKEEESFDEEQYSPWAQSREDAKAFTLDKTSIFSILVVLAVVISITALLMGFLGKAADPISQGQLALLQERVNQLEGRLSRYDAMDEKVNHILEQSRFLEKLKERSERAEPSLEKGQKPAPAATISSPAGAPPAKAAPVRMAAIQYHTVAAGDTLFSLSRRYHMEVSELLRLNALTPQSVLHIGQKLVVKK